MRQLSWVALGVCACALGCSGEPGDAQMSAAATTTTGTHSTQTKYPIVLIPGLLGFRTILGTVDYFTGIPEALAADGALVFVAQVSQAHTPEARGQQVIAQLEAWRAQTGAEKFNLVGHSAGALDARYIAGERPELVASVTSIGGPHLGAPAAQMALDLPVGLGPSFMQALSDLVKLVSDSPDPNDARQALMWLSPRGAATFAARYPAAMPATPCGSGAPVVGGIRYYSWGGVGTLTNALDLLDAVWVALSVNDLTDANDGLINRCSSHLGEVLRDNYIANHTDETNLVFGLISPFGPDPKALYRNQANRLRNAGL
jgi:triacylglycerol lipase